MSTREEIMTKGIQKLLQAKRDHLQKMRVAGRAIEVYLTELEIREILVFAFP